MTLAWRCWSSYPREGLGSGSHKTVCISFDTATVANDGFEKMARAGNAQDVWTATTEGRANILNSPFAGLRLGGHKYRTTRTDEKRGVWQPPTERRISKAAVQTVLWQSVTPGLLSDSRQYSCHIFSHALHPLRRTCVGSSRPNARVSFLIRSPSSVIR